MTDIINDDKEEFASRFAQYSKYGAQFRRALDATLSASVKRHLFKPSNRSLYTVVGRNGDEFIDPERPFCSCESYFYSVLSGKTRYCYHILAYKMAQESGLIEEIRFDDEEYDEFFALLFRDIWTR